MAKYCTQCGAKLDDDDLFCGVCGVSVSEYTHDGDSAKNDEPFVEEPVYETITSRKENVWLHDTVCLCPAKSAIRWQEVMSLFENDIDFSVAVLCNPTIASQLHIIGNDAEHLIANAWNSQWDCVLLGALFNHNVMCNLQSDQPIEEIAKAEYIHITNYELRALLSEFYCISEEDEVWLEKHYKTAYQLLEKENFQTAVHTMASYRWHSVPRVQLAVIWSGIESLFNVNTEVSFRISLYIANFLGENEAQAQQIFKQVRKMYSLRSSAVHGNKTKDNLESAVEESANLLNRILRKCAELNRLPDVDNLVFNIGTPT